MARSKCSKDLYKSFLQASSVRYSGKALSEVSPVNHSALQVQSLILRHECLMYVLT
ncbi:hypothetical protein [Candidatus Tisiphia endosymbiont of Parasteatoda lunata]|uniref:hypothetical protein n=1 Tax=Candidatus Tisiphia endosymbiont of Parasteatoda lunata TaxID=3066275 RepID=UPI00313D928D